ncbi:MAG: glycosyltransferase family 4 protein [Verrucomicrobiota bacterium]|nr:glycosyltransferase family 4 protein [Verrucomicrobiota bacterium]
MVLLIGNYPADQQQSMQRFGTMMLEGLTAAGVAAELIQPEPFFGRMKIAGPFVAKWLAYIDKFLLFPRRLRRKLAASFSIVHICDHSNAIYSCQIKNTPVLVTCHDLLAVRGALGEETDCPASFTGNYLQRWILAGLRRATAVACVSYATLRDAERLIDHNRGQPELHVVPNGLNYPYRKQTHEVVQSRLRGFERLDLKRPFLLHVGSNLRRKNREGVLRIFGLTKNKWNGQLVFAGDPLGNELHSLGEKLGLLERIVEVVNPNSESLEALYSSATALLYPSRFEGFGWPVIEAQACGCPVICSNRGPLPEVGGEAALMHEVDDEEGFAADILRLLDPAERERWSKKSLRNAENFSAEKTIARYLELYRGLGAQF